MNDIVLKEVKCRVKGRDTVQNRREPSILADWGNTAKREGENKDMRIGGDGQLRSKRKQSMDSGRKQKRNNGGLDR